MQAVKGLFKKSTGSTSSAPGSTASNQNSIVPSQTLRERDVYRYRKHRGVNLGSWFVLERWISDAPFRNARPPSQSDYDVACGPSSKEVLQRHWDTWMSESDWRWITERGLNAVRIPIGYYHLFGLNSEILKGTDFDGLGDVFEGAWDRICSACITAHQHGLGVLLDLHAAPGKQNGDAHSGKTGPVHFYKPVNMTHTIHVLRVLMEAVRDMPNLIGVQLLNEPQNSDKLQGWYDESISSLRQISADVPLYIHDSWDTNHYSSYVGRKPTFVVLDHHLYRCFTPQDHRLSGEQHAEALRGSTSETFNQHSSSSNGRLVVAEFSAALNPASMPVGSDAGEQDRQRRVFARAQLELYESTCGGWFFWTYKKDSGWDAGWSLRDATTAEIMPNWYGTKTPEAAPSLDSEKLSVAKERALNAHTAYWDRYPGQYEHWRFGDGFSQGWKDAYEFSAFEHDKGRPSMSEIGFVKQLAQARAVAHAQETTSWDSKNLWEYEHGFSQGALSGWQDILSCYTSS